MYNLWYDEVTGQYFVADGVELKAKLKTLEKKYCFSLNEYCKAIGIPEEDPFDTCKFYSFEFDPGCTFFIDLGFVNMSKVVAWKVGINRGFV